jgi:putative redox protein
MVPFTITYDGDLRCTATHGPSRTTLITDAPVDNHGKGESFSPTDLLVTAMATCMATTMGIVARRDGIRLEGLTVAAEKHMSASPPRKVARMVLRFAMPAGIPAERRAVLERAAHTCPVGLSLHPDVVADVSFTYPD